MDNSDLWSKILEKVKSESSSLSYSTWFADTKLHQIDKGVATIIVPFPIHKKHLEDNYKDYIKSLFIEEIGENVELEFVIEEELEKEVEPVINSSVDNTSKTDEDIPFESNLNKKYTFDTFVVGNSNKFAHAAAVAVADSLNDFVPDFVSSILPFEEYVL